MAATRTTTATRTAPPARGTTSLTLRINDAEYSLWKVPAQAGDVTACYELKKRGSPDRYHVSQHDHGAECTCGDFVFRRNHIDNRGCKHIRSLTVFGLIDPPAADADLARLPAPAPAPTPPIEARRPAGAVHPDAGRAGVHPLEAAGLGPAPFTLFATIRLPAASQGGTARRSAQVDAAERLYRVKAGFCYACKSPKDETFVIERADRKNAAVCRNCVNALGGAVMVRKLAHLDHEADRLARRCGRDRGRRP
jgi:hypothetical protein